MKQRKAKRGVSGTGHWGARETAAGNLHWQIGRASAAEKRKAPQNRTRVSLATLNLPTP